MLRSKQSPRAIKNPNSHSSLFPELTMLYRVIIVVLIGAVGFLIEDNWEEHKTENLAFKSKDTEILKELKAIKKNQESFASHFKTSIQAEYISTHYVAVIANGERILLKRVYVSEVPNITPELAIYKESKEIVKE